MRVSVGCNEPRNKVAQAELLADLLHVDRLSGVRLRGVAGDDLKKRTRESGEDGVGEFIRHRLGKRLPRWSRRSRSAEG